MVDKINGNLYIFDRFVGPGFFFFNYSVETRTLENGFCTVNIVFCDVALE